MITMYPTEPFIPATKINYAVKLDLSEHQQVWVKIFDKKWSFADGRLPPAVTCFGHHNGNDYLLLHDNCVIGLGNRHGSSGTGEVRYDMKEDTLTAKKVVEPIRGMEFGSSRTDFNDGSCYNTNPTDIHTTIARTALHRLFNLHRTHFSEMDNIAEIHFSPLNDRHNSNNQCIVYYKGGVYILREDFSEDPLPRARKERKKFSSIRARSTTVYHTSVVKHKEDGKVPDATYLLKNADLIYRPSIPPYTRGTGPARCTISIQTKFDMQTGSEENTKALLDLLGVEYDVYEGFKTMELEDGTQQLCPSTFVSGEHEWAMVKTKALRFNDEFLKLAGELCGFKNVKSGALRYFNDSADAVLTEAEVKYISESTNSINPIVQVFLDHKEIEAVDDDRARGSFNSRNSNALESCLKEPDFVDWVNAQLEEVDVYVPVLTPRLGTVLNARLANMQAIGMIPHRSMPGLQRPTPKDWFRAGVFSFEYNDGYGYEF